MELSVIIPCFNEVKTIEQVVQAVKSSPIKHFDGNGKRTAPYVLT